MQALLQNVLTFNELARKLKPITNKILSERLQDLETEHLIQKKIFPGKPVKVKYALTQKGVGLLEVFVAMKKWAVSYGVVVEDCITENCVDCPHHP